MDHDQIRITTNNRRTAIKKRRIQAGESSSINNKSVHHKIIHEKSSVEMVEQTEKIPLAGSLLCLILCNVQKLGCVCARQCRCRLLCALTNGNKHNMIRNETDMFGQSLYMFAVQAVKQTSKHTHAGWCSSLIHIISANRRIMSSLEYFQTERMSQLSEQHSERNKKRWLTSYI